MPKIKTRKTVTKRFGVTGSKKKKAKVTRRKSRQNHFNAKESTKTKHGKRSDSLVTGKVAKSIRAEMPYV